MGNCYAKSTVPNDVEKTRTRKQNVQSDSTDRPRVRTMLAKADSMFRRSSTVDGNYPIQEYIDEYPYLKTVVAVYRFDTSADNTISFEQYDTMDIYDTGKQSDWLLAKNRRTEEVGFVPVTFVVEGDADEIIRPWLFKDISKTEATRKLKSREHPVGTFLIRLSERDPNANRLVLSVKKAPAVVVHYNIFKENKEYFMKPSDKFASMEEFLEFYYEAQLLSEYLPRAKPAVKDINPNMSDNWEIDRSRIILGNLLGSGNFGDVYSATIDGQTVAVKTLKTGSMSTEAFLKEATVMKSCHHKNLVQLFAICSRDEPLYIVTEYMSCGNVRDYLRNHGPKEFSEQAYIVREIACGMAYLESHSLIHRDLAARNVLIGEPDYMVKVADFGLARIIEDDEYTVSVGTKFPFRWTAPEALFQSKYSVKSDVWAFGIVLIEVFTNGGTPYPGCTREDITRLLEKGKRMRKSKEVPDAIHELTDACWAQKPEKRPAFDSLQQSLNDLLEGETQFVYDGEE